MKRLLIVTPSFNTGGTTTSLINLLPLLPRDKYKVDVFPISNTGSAGNTIAKYATLLVPNSIEIESNRNNAKVKAYNFTVATVKTIKRALCKIGIDISPLFLKRTAEQLQRGNYDIVIAFQEGHPTSLVKHISGPLKVAWVHSIYSRFSAALDKKKLLNDYERFDKIVCVSNIATEDMRNEVPSLADKIYTVYNGLNIERIEELSKEFIVKNNKFTLISIGRIDPVKRFSEIPPIARMIKDKGVSFVWTIIGGIADEKEAVLLKERISKYKLEDCVSWIGEKTNPYPFLQSSDLLVCLSSSETFNYTLAEARALNVPIITTDFPAAKEFVNNNVSGIIAPIEKIGDTIYELITDSCLYNRIKQGSNKDVEWNKQVINHINQILS